MPTRPIINQYNRLIYRTCPDTINWALVGYELATLHFKREIKRSFEKSFLFKFIFKTNYILTKNAVSSMGKQNK